MTSARKKHPSAPLRTSSTSAAAAYLFVRLNQAPHEAIYACQSVDIRLNTGPAQPIITSQAMQQIPMPMPISMPRGSSRMTRVTISILHQLRFIGGKWEKDTKKRYNLG